MFLKMSFSNNLYKEGQESSWWVKNSAISLNCSSLSRTKSLGSLWSK